MLWIHLVSLCLIMTTASSISASENSWRQAGVIKHSFLTEISGIVAAHTFDGYWVHNDSGDEPRIYAINKRGNLLGTFQLAQTAAIDWEDMAAFTIAGQRYLAIGGDIGDNNALRPHISLHFIREPELNTKQDSNEVVPDQTLLTQRYIYPEHFLADGTKRRARDAECLAIEPQTREIFIISKRETRPVLFHAAMPELTKPADKPIELEQLAAFSLPQPSAES